MSLPTTGILDNYNLRYNFGTATLEMNVGGEDWEPVPGSFSGAAGEDTQIQFNDSGDLGASSKLTWQPGDSLVVGESDFSGAVLTVQPAAMEVLDDGDSVSAWAHVGTDTIFIATAGNPTPNAHAALEVVSTTKGFLPPRMTTTQRDAVATPPEGLMIMNTSTHALNVFDGTDWQEIAVV